MRNMCVHDAPCWDRNVLNASCSNCNCERVFASSAKLQLALPVRGLERRMRIQNVASKIHFPVPKCLCKQGTKKCLQQYSIRIFSASICLQYLCLLLCNYKLQR